MADEEEVDDLSFGSLRRHDDAGSPTGLLDKVLGEEDTFAAASPQNIVAAGRTKLSGEIKPLAVNQATMCCHRGPCMHLWALTTRAEAQIRGWDKIQISRLRQCNAHYEPTNLTEANVFECGLWWPAQLSFVPVSLRAVLRPRLHRLWDRYLRAVGYDFTWKHWKDDVFEKDTVEDRKQALPPTQPNSLFFNEGNPTE